MRHLFKSISYSLVGLSFALLASCGGQEPKVDTAQATKTINTVAPATSSSPASTDPLQTGTGTSTGTSNVSTPLLASLAMLYPDGKMPENMAAEAAKQSAQNPRALKNTGRSADLRLPSSFTRATVQQPQSMRSGDGLYAPIYRYINSDLYGAYFFSTYAILRSIAQFGGPNYVSEEPLFEVAEVGRVGLSPVYRFRNKFNNTKIETIDPEDPALANLYEYESIAWYASKYQYTGWTPLYRFRNKVNDSYLYTASQYEASVIDESYRQVFAYAGIAYYVKEFLPKPTPYFSIHPNVATQNVKTDFVVVGTNVPLDAQLSFPSLTCETPTNRTSTGFGQKCTMNGGTEVLGMVMSGGGAKLLGYRQIELIPATVEPIYTGNLPDTGVTSEQCYGAGSNVLISCTSAAAIALNPKQDGMIGRDVTAPAAADGKLGFSYSDVPNPAGGVYDKTECVKDNLTSLTWEGKTTSGLRSAINTYTNYDSTTEIQALDGNTGLTPTQAQVDATTNTVGYKNYVNNIALCGYTDWRLPEIEEINVLLDIDNVPNANWHLDTTWFPNNLWTFYTANYFWSSTEGAAVQDSTRAWLLDLDRGESEIWPRSNHMSVRLVRGGTTASTNRYSYINSGTEVLDSKTKLIWRRCTEGTAWDGAACIGRASSFTHEQALIHANTQTGWRLPNVKELTSILDLSVTHPSIDSAVSPTWDQRSHVSSTPNTNSPGLFWNAYEVTSRNFRGWSAKLVRNAP
jgi:hypothetical protein